MLLFPTNFEWIGAMCTDAPCSAAAIQDPALATGVPVAAHGSPEMGITACFGRERF